MKKNNDAQAESLWREGFACMQNKEYTQAIELLERALASPGKYQLEILLYLAEAYHLADRPLQAAETINQACDVLATEKDKGTQKFQHDIATRQGEYNRPVGNVDIALAGYRRAIELLPTEAVADRMGTYSSYLLTLMNCPEVTGADICAYVEEYAEMFREGIFATPRRAPQSDGRIRLAYISPDFRRHVMFNFYYILLSKYSKDKFYVICYDLTRPDKRDGYTAHLKILVDEWQEVDELSLEELAQQIYHDNVDILVDLAGHTAYSGLPVLGYHVAPVQISGLGWMEPTGLADYLITDKYLDGNLGDGYESYLTERPLYLTSQFCYVGRSDVPMPQGAPCEQNGYITFGSFNSYHKITDKMLSLWAEILCRMPESQLLLKCYVFREEKMRQSFRERCAQVGIDASRLILEPATTDYMERYQAVDIALDTYPYPGGGTTLDALYMGVPVVSLYGTTGARRGSRFGLSILANAGLEMLAVPTEAEYIERAVLLATEWDVLGELHRNLREILQHSPVMNGKLYMQELETQYTKLHRGR